MKKFISEFSRRGLTACGFGPLVLAVVYIILQKCSLIYQLSVSQVYTGIFSLSALAFIAGGINAIYQIEKLPLMAAILIHGVVLYSGYLGAYMINGWLDSGTKSIVVFSVIFVVFYIAIWAFIYTVTRKRTSTINESLKKKQESLKNI